MTAQERKELRCAVADYMRATDLWHWTGADRNRRRQEEAERRLAILLEVPEYDDESGYQFGQFTSK